MSQENAFSEGDLSRIIEMAWQDCTPFEALKHQFGLNESAVIVLMRASLKRTSFRMWRKRVTGRGSKHQRLSTRRPADMSAIEGELD